MDGCRINKHTLVMMYECGKKGDGAEQLALLIFNTGIIRIRKPINLFLYQIWKTLVPVIFICVNMDTHIKVIHTVQSFLYMIRLLYIFPIHRNSVMIKL